MIRYGKPCLHAGDGQSDIRHAAHAFVIKAALDDRYFNGARGQACSNGGFIKLFRLWHPDCNFDPHLGWMLELVKQGQRTVTDCVGDGAQGGFGIIVAMHICAHAEFKN